MAPPCRGAGSARQRLRGYSADSPALSQPFNFLMSLCRVRRLDAPLPPPAAQHDAGKFYLIPSLPTLSKHFIFYSVSAFSFYLKKKTPAKEKQNRGESPLYPRERRTAVHSLLFSVGSSAHSPVNSLRSNSTGSCGLLCKPSPRSSQIACSTAARLLEACSSKFIKSLTLPCGKCSYSLFFVFCVFRKATICRINLGRIISDYTRFNIRQPLYFLGEQSCPCGVPLETAPQIIACPRRILPITSRKRVLF